MEHIFPYEECQTFSELLKIVRLNSVYNYLCEQNIKAELENEHFLYHRTLESALQKEKASSIDKSFCEILLYLMTNENDLSDFFAIVYAELIKAMVTRGYAIHQEKKAKFKKNSKNLHKKRQ